VEGRRGNNQGNGRSSGPIRKIAGAENIEALYPEQAGRIADTLGVPKKECAPQAINFINA
jgi:hypothetical protein